MRLITMTAIAALALTTAACTKNKKAEDMPPPVDAPATSSAAPADTSVATSDVTPGSQADLVASAGSDRVLFEYDSFELTGEARGILTRQAEWLQKYPSVAFTVEGHADERGTREYNLALGDRRANATKNFLAAQGVAATRLRTISYGKERPEVQGSDESGYAQNRRAVSVVSGAAS
ncbi:peptidoglycan-associated lipoprotein Pal [Sphingoaurantiacus capsulatus]|uniref:Peptidoglycan-associated lipoprotein n=1 Tax=Sphingoaurantiacus capsulatus TaxID=1771310 RepID=A0ABV7XCX7_9SPHN